MTSRSRATAIPLATPRADTVAAGLFAGAVGASLLALFFLAVDVVRGEALATPSLVAAVVLEGAAPGQVGPVDLTRVASFSLLHGVLFVGFAMVATFVVQRLRTLPDLPLLAIGLALGLEAGFLAGNALLAPGLGEAIGHGAVLAGNALAATGMAVVMRRELSR